MDDDDEYFTSIGTIFLPFRIKKSILISVFLVFSFRRA